MILLEKGNENNFKIGLKLEKESPEKFKLNYSLKEDDFFSREDYYKIHPEKK